MTVPGRPGGRARKAADGPAPRAGRAAGIVLVCLAAPAVGAEVDQLAAEIFETEQEARRLDAGFAEPVVDRADAARRRLLDAQVLFELQDWARASILFLDTVEQYPQSAVHDEALFYLAESLLELRNLRSARASYQELAARPKSTYHYGALGRLVEIALRTGETDGVHELIRRMGDLAADPTKAGAPYVRAKFLYFRESSEEAIAAFDAIPDDHPYGRHARYFAAVCRVKKGDLDGAAKIFERAIKLAPRSDGERHVLELARLGLGRVHYERGGLRQAVTAYQSVAQTSEVFATALQEIAWVYVRDKQFENALRALDLLLLARPDGPETPEVSVLQGNLLIRTKQFDRAKRLFSATSERYGPQYRELHARMGQETDPLSYLDELLAGRVVAAATPVVRMPRLAAIWAREQPDVQRALDLLEDVAQFERDLAESESILERLEPALRGPARARIFPDLAAGLTRSARLAKRLAAARTRLLELQRDGIGTAASPQERDALGALAAQRRQIEARIEALPRAVSERESRDQRVRGGYEAAGKRLAELSGRIGNLSGQLAAMERYVADNRVTGEEAASFARQAEGIRALITTLTEEERQLRSALGEGRRTVGADDASVGDGTKLLRRREEILADERRRLVGISSRMDGPAQQRGRRVDDLLGRAATAQAALDRFAEAIEERIEQRLVGIRATLEAERQALAQQRAEVTATASEARQAAAAVARGSFDRVLQRFRDVSVMGEVGLLDVAWALKQDRSEAVSRLIQEQKTELQILEEGFEGVVQGAE